MKRIDGGIGAVKGFMLSSAAAQIKYENHPDMALIVSDFGCTAAAVYTKNVVKAAPVVFDREITESDKKVKAVVVNTGIANASTGEEGMRICRETAEDVKAALKTDGDEVLVASTGVIGAQVPLDRIKAGIGMMKDNLSDSVEAADAAARAIMTTDTHPKQIALTFDINGVPVTIGAMSKGSGMIHPDMCTMLAFICTDAMITKKLLKKALKDAVSKSFNMISVDGDMSTNDSCFLLSNGAAGNPAIEKEDENYRTFTGALSIITMYLAESMAEDGEGATKLIECRVVNASGYDEAARLAKAVIESDLLKAAVYGNDANWGRIMCAMGYSGVTFDPSKTDVYISQGITPEGEAAAKLDGTFEEYPAPGFILAKGGETAGFDEDVATKLLSSRHVVITCDMHEGSACARAFGCDLTYDYVKINADYRS